MEIKGANGVEISVQQPMILLSAGGRALTAMPTDIKQCIARTQSKIFLQLEELSRKLNSIIKM